MQKEIEEKCKKAEWIAWRGGQKMEGRRSSGVGGLPLSIESYRLSVREKETKGLKAETYLVHL